MATINNLRSLGKTYPNQDHVRKILRSLPRQWRLKVTVIQEAKDLSTLALEELWESIKVQELELREENGDRKGKSIVLKAHKGGSSKAFSAEESNGYEEEGLDDGDELSFISKRVQAIWKKMGGFRRKQFNKIFSKDKIEQKEESSVICYECKKPRRIVAEWPNLEKTKKKFFKKKKKGLMAIWEDLDF